MNYSFFLRYLKHEVTNVKSKKLIEIIQTAKEDDLKAIPLVGVQTELELAKTKRHVSHHRLLLSFYASATKFLSAMSQKLAERTPMQYPVVRQVRVLPKISVTIFILINSNHQFSGPRFEPCTDCYPSRIIEDFVYTFGQNIDQQINYI